MDFDLSSDQVALLDAASGFLDDRCASRHVRSAADHGGFDLSLWTLMVDQGWIGITTSESAGGLGMGSVEAAVLLEQLGRHLAPVPLNQHLNALHVLADTPWSEGLLEGSLIATVARRSVVRNGDGSVTGRPEPVIYGASADLLVVPAGDELVAVDLTAIDRKPEPAMDRTRQLAWVGMDEAPAVTVGDASAVAAHLDRGAVFHSVELLGAAGAVMDIAVDYAGQREQFGQPIGAFQAVKHRCADMLVDVEGMRSTAYHAAWSIGAGDPDASVAAAVAKIWCSDAGLRVAESALQVHGGIGFTWESDVHLYLKRIQLDQVSLATPSTTGHASGRLSASESATVHPSSDPFPGPTVASAFGPALLRGEPGPSRLPHRSGGTPWCLRGPPGQPTRARPGRREAAGRRR